ncbi:MAG TPA: nuclear transport factor 2 family protein [Burkholderiales bacterium]|nr:nuclear transport factor 2 family protein [Burkholderiales bacterium]
MLKGLLRALYAYAVLGALSVGVAVAGDCTAPITSDEALGGEDARYAAQTSGDFGALERLIGDDLVYIHASALVDSKTSYIESQRSGTVRYRVMKRSNVTVRTYGCVAIITGQGIFDVTVKGQDRSVELLFHSIWAKRDSGVQFISWQATLMPAKQ